MALNVLEVFQPPDGGVAEHVRLLAEGLHARGHTVTVAGPPDARPRASLEAAGIRYVGLPDIVGDMIDARRDARTLRQIARLLREQPRFDVIHLHSQKAGLLGRVVAALTRTPVIYTPHSLLHRFMRDPRWGHHNRRAYLNTIVMERVLGNVATAALVGVSQEERQGAVDDHIVADRRAHAILNGAEIDDTAAADPELLAFRGEGPLVGFLAGLRLQKGLPVLLDALELLAARGKAPKAAICGSGELEAEISARIASGPLAATTMMQPFSGRVEPPLLAFDIYVLPSYFEGLPLAALEAMAAGLPVIATDAGGTVEAVADGETGFIVGVGDVAALADRIERLVEDPDLRARMGAAGRARYEARFGVDRMVDRAAELYAEVAAHGRGARLPR